MNTEISVASHEVTTFEEYTLYSLERTAPALLKMMDRSRRVSSMWPDIMAMADSAGLCQELAALACFQDTLDDVFQLSEAGVPELSKWLLMRSRIKLVMDTLEDALGLNEPGAIKRLFAVELPEALNLFIEVIPAVADHIRDQYQSLPLEEATAGVEG